VFGTFEAIPAGWPAIPNTPGERQLAGAMLDYWTSFAHSGRPSAANGPAWESFAPNRSYMLFGDAPRLSQQFMPGMYELHEQIMCRRRQAGTQSWNWRTGSIAPTLPASMPGCSGE
jgi:para-nitrobenzyl esterase